MNPQKPYPLDPRESENAIHLSQALRSWLSNLSSKEVKNNLFDKALDAVNKALTETRKYQRHLREGGERNRKNEDLLTELWGDASSEIRPFDQELAYLCWVKGHGWADEVVWDNPIYKELPIALDQILERLRDLSEQRPAILGTKKDLVITLHGIRTFAPWQKDLADELGKAGFNTKSLQYGYFSSLRLIRPSQRRKSIEWFRDQYTQISREYPDVVPSIIAHSFGTYLVARALEMFDGIKFDQVILCGSIVPQDYDWNQLFENGQVNRVLNECAKKDIVVKAAPFFVQDAGPSGAHGFDQNSDGALCQRSISKFGHSDYLHVLNFTNNWFPFLKEPLHQEIAHP